MVDHQAPVRGRSRLGYLKGDLFHAGEHDLGLIAVDLIDALSFE